MNFGEFLCHVHDRLKLTRLELLELREMLPACEAAQAGYRWAAFLPARPPVHCVSYHEFISTKFRTKPAWAEEGDVGVDNRDN
ncbi:hypothetical protein AGR7A_pTi0107 [Agrobacterium deltaense NCPPB 1641]|uniref:Uncharacterized protein n=1 Tax=Agrobacterium deltaense NCPPB 1641 TaxID=1183425 RepID=A0A1S7UC29_9HYPH|nr:hypothetical protein AGR7A_pTi0107 [Agrobacterium deltaense NCPPB 1641]